VGQPQEFDKLGAAAEGQEDKGPGGWPRQAMECAVALVPELRASEDDVFS
jgi:hypothetical protein